jgi:hypothetical protein
MPDNRIRVLTDVEDARLRETVKARLAKNLGMPTPGLADAFSKLVDEQVTIALDEQARRLARDVAVSQARAKLTQHVDVAAAVSTRLGAALTGVKQVSGNPDAKRVMDESARLVRMKFESLVAAGFSEDQAFQLLLTESARRSK